MNRIIFQSNAQVFSCCRKLSSCLHDTILAPRQDVISTPTAPHRVAAEITPLTKEMCVVFVCFFISPALSLTILMDISHSSLVWCSVQALENLKVVILTCLSCNLLHQVFSSVSYTFSWGDLRKELLQTTEEQIHTLIHYIMYDLWSPCLQKVFFCGYCYVFSFYSQFSWLNKTAKQFMVAWLDLCLSNDLWLHLQILYFFRYQIYVQCLQVKVSKERIKLLDLSILRKSH